MKTSSPATGWATRVRRALAQLSRRQRLGALVLAVACACAGTAVVSLAQFTASGTTTASLSAGRIFPGVRTTSAFIVADTSGGGAPVDRTSPFALPSDGRTTTTGAWATAFASDRYLQFDLNAPLPASLSVSSVSLALRLASASPSGTVCVYAQVRRISDDTPLATYGSSGSPLGCTTGTSQASLSISLPIVTTTDDANDLRVRIFGRDSAAAASVLDELTVSGSTPYAAFVLYPVRYTDAATSIPDSVPWELQGP